jgi:hypothetical protein
VVFAQGPALPGIAPRNLVGDLQELSFFPKQLLLKENIQLLSVNSFKELLFLVFLTNPIPSKDLQYSYIAVQLSKTVQQIPSCNNYTPPQRNEALNQYHTEASVITQWTAKLASISAVAGLPAMYQRTTHPWPSAVSVTVSLRR